MDPLTNTSTAQPPRFNHPALSELVDTVDVTAAGDGIRSLAGDLSAAMAPALGIAPSALRALCIKALQLWQVDCGQPADQIAGFGLAARIEALRSVCGHLSSLLTPLVDSGTLETAVDAGFKAFERTFAEA